MAELKLTPGNTYSLKVTAFTPKNKTIPKADGKKYDLYFVTVEDKNGDSVGCEYPAPQGTCADCFVVGVFQFVKCCYLSPRGTPEVVPGEDPAAIAPGRLVKGDDGPPNIYAVSMSGKAITFATGYAKDILCAEIAQQPFGYKVTNEDLERMMGWADVISTGLTDRATF